MKWNITLETKKGSSEVKLDFSKKEVKIGISQEFIAEATDALIDCVLDGIFGKKK